MQTKVREGFRRAEEKIVEARMKLLAGDYVTSQQLCHDARVILAIAAENLNYAQVQKASEIQREASP